jgi:general secretion pathway protein A
MYLSHFGFTQEPFGFAPDPHFLYLSPSHAEALSSMNSVIKERLGTITITGDVGTGKTTLVYTLLETLDKNVKSAFIFNPKVSFEDLLKSALIDLGVPTQENALYALLQLFNLYLKERLSANEPVALVIDEAQNMDMEVLEGVNRLSKRETPASKLLQIILVGQPELEKNLDSPGLREFNKRIAIRRQISPLSHAETKSYLDHRLKIVGSGSLKVFTPEAIELICKNAAGIPRVINQICDHAFLTGYTLSTQKVDAKILKEVIKDLSRVISPKPKIVPDIKPIYLLFFFLGLVAFGLGFLYFLNRDWNPSNLPKPPLESKMEPPSLAEKAKGSFTKEISPAKQDWETIKVKEGWSLSILAQQYYQSADLYFVDFLLEANPQIINANMIHVNDEIRIPRVTEEVFLVPSGNQTYKIHLGTFKHQRFLKNFENQPALRGKEFQIVTRKVSPQETWYRIIVGEFQDKEEGLKGIRMLRAKGLLPAFSGS